MFQSRLGLEVVIFEELQYMIFVIQRILYCLHSSCPWYVSNQSWWRPAIHNLIWRKTSGGVPISIVPEMSSRQPFDSLLLFGTTETLQIGLQVLIDPL